MVDDVDYPMLSQYSWRVSICKHGCYAVRTQLRSEVSAYSERKNIYMHAMILDIPNGMICHHKNDNGLDNRCKNLKPITYLENWRQSNESTTESKNESGVPF